MKILIVSDSHGLEEELLQLKKQHQHEVDLMIHCGDSELSVGDVALKDFSIVRGNCDFDTQLPEEKIEVLEDVKILTTHGHLYSVKSSLMSLSYRAKEINANIVCFGHSHIFGAEVMDNILYINPGSIRLPRGRKEKTYCILTTNSLNQYKLEVYDLHNGLIPELTMEME